jgi:hypothetical protein
MKLASLILQTPHIPRRRPSEQLVRGGRLGWRDIH